MLLLAALLSSSALASPPALSAGWLGEFVTHPGLFVGVEQSFGHEARLRSFAGARLGLYHHPRHHTGALALGEGGLRLVARAGLYGELSAGLGVHHRFLAGPVYVREGQEVVRRVDGGRPTALGELAAGVGWDFGERGASPLRLFGRVHGWGRAPVNHGLLPALAVSVGVAYPLGGGR